MNSRRKPKVILFQLLGVIEVNDPVCDRSILPIDEKIDNFWAFLEVKFVIKLCQPTLHTEERPAPSVF